VTRVDRLQLQVRTLVARVDALGAVLAVRTARRKRARDRVLNHR
jgi:hypothetical protein